MGLHSPLLPIHPIPPHHASAFPTTQSPSVGLGASWRDAQGVARIVVLRSRRGWTLCCLVAGMIFVVIVFSRQLGAEEIDRFVDLTVQQYSRSTAFRSRSGLGYAETEFGE